MTDVVEGPVDGLAARRVPQALLVALAATAVLGTGVDRVAADGEQRALLACVEAGEAVQAHEAARAAGTVQYASPQLTGASTPAAVRASLEALVAGVAGEAAPQVDAARADCAGVGALAWHGRERRARDAYAALLAAERDRWRAVATDVSVLFEPDASVAALRSRALASLVAALAGEQERRVRDLLGA
ncbi:MAG: hypothetical protein Q8R60_02110 [Mycobacteriales bacterium]|nr:hypothetical protein [Mycobacteriales bacterium]